MVDDKDIFTKMLHCEPDITTQLYLALFYSVIIELFVMKPVKAIAEAVSSGKPWKKATVQLEKEMLLKTFNIDTTHELANKYWCEKWAWSAQHTLGACLCLPGFLGYGDPYWGLLLSKHGAFCELGYEIVDFINKYYERLFDEDGR